MSIQDSTYWKQVAESLSCELGKKLPRCPPDIICPYLSQGCADCWLQYVIAHLKVSPMKTLEQRLDSHVKHMQHLESARGFALRSGILEVNG